MLQFIHLQPRVDLGLLPQMWDVTDPRPARVQAADNYAHGGGWSPFKGFKFDAVKQVLTYSGDPPMRALAYAQLRDETIIVYDYAWVMILQKDGSFEISRMD